MSFEKTSNEKIPRPLAYWFHRLSSEAKAIIEVEIFNTSKAIPLETALDAITDHETARGIMERFRRYLAHKESKLGNAELKIEADEIAAYVEKKALES